MTTKARASTVEAAGACPRRRDIPKAGHAEARFAAGASTARQHRRKQHRKKEDTTMAIVRWDPFRELTALQGEVNRLFSRVGGGEVSERQSWIPSVDVVENKDAITLKADLAGMDPDDIHLEVEDNVLTVSGERRFQEEIEEDKYYRIERRYGSFTRSIALPQGADSEKIDAEYENGVLVVTVPKVEAVKPKRITVGVKGLSPETVEGTGSESAEE
jgi:HSP20 family protein